MTKAVSFFMVFIAILPLICSDVAEAKPMISVMQQDVDGDKKPENFVYALEEAKESFKCSLTITTGEGKELWAHQWRMRKRDLVDDLLVNEGNISLKTWVKNFLNGKLTYGGKFLKAKLKPEELQDDVMDQYAEQAQVETEALKKEILALKENMIFFYRSVWRETLIMLVYVPSQKKMVQYSVGEY